MRKILMAQAVLGSRRVFYVDATGGLDTNTGRSTSAAWQTIAKVNGYTFRRGDQILFKRGETWTGTQLTVPTHGLTFGAYGAGAKPILNGFDTVNTLSFNGKHFTRLENLDVRNGLDTCIIVGGNYGVISNCDTNRAGNDNILMSGKGHVITGGTHINPYRRLLDGRLVTCIEILEGSSYITINNVTCSGSFYAGMSIQAHATYELPDHITVNDSNFTGNSVGIFVGLAEAGALCSGQKDIVFNRCNSYSNTTYGIIFQRQAPQYPSGVTFNDCRIYDNTNAPLQSHCDYLTLNRTLLDGWAIIQESKYVTLRNVTIYNSSATAAYALHLDGTRSQNFSMKNCIIMDNTAGHIIIEIAAATGVTGWDVNYNLYRRGNGGGPTLLHWYWLGVAKNWADWKTASGGDANSPTPADPTFVNPATNDFTLQVGSPAINAGVDVGFTYLGVAPDCGAYEKA